MVKAILDGRKTMTRRVVKPVLGPQALWEPWEGVGTYRPMGVTADIPIEARATILYSPYHVGQRLWVRETWAPLPGGPITKDNGVIYRADDGNAKWTWKPSIFMPRWASRITLEVTSVRVERLNNITEEDAEKEGCEGLCPFHLCNGRGYLPQQHTATEPVECKCGDLTQTDVFAELWESINGKGSWAQNPYVWVVSFKRL